MNINKVFDSLFEKKKLHILYIVFITTIFFTFSGGCGFKFNGSDALISGNQIHDIGVSFPSSAALYATGEHMHIYRNEIFKGPYSGITLWKR
jgi:hypothetical protein